METQRDERTNREGWSRRRFASAILILAVPVALGCELDRISGVEDFDGLDGLGNPAPEEVAEELDGEAGDDETAGFRGSNDEEKEGHGGKPYREYR